ncbi:MAG: 2-octaprenyl-3-methyl-6-methoxy-1,4-benzoquinol hydroxylase [Gammaproteobacteria bacterium]|nr:MAG: 2-octaprenyl-3-methyl-6-methoxy-1,4-benzoquinol hydroxylase [Gammaproteobacteria bacterium]
MSEQNTASVDVDCVDIVIVGGGIVGLCFANALIDADFSVVVIERSELKINVAELRDEKFSDARPDCRVSAINRSALKHLIRVGVIDSPRSKKALAERICVFEKMFVWDQTGAGQIQFDSAELGVSELGAIIENNILQQLLLDNIAPAKNITYLCPEEIAGIDYRQAEPASVTLSSGKKIQAKLLVGADGVNSKVGNVASIARTKHPYQQLGVVCNVSTCESHQATAWQCFMPSGPLAFLPLFNGQCSIVWSLDEAAAKQMMALDDAAFKIALAEASDYKLGEILEVSQRFSFPLSHGHAVEYVRPGLALIGDAAHNIHPLAGQGANLGIADAFALAEIIIAAKQANRQWCALHTLAKYQRQRKGANQLMEVSMTAFKELFGQDNPFLSEIRNAGLSLVDHLPALKYKIIQQALGVID